MNRPPINWIHPDGGHNTSGRRTVRVSITRNGTGHDGSERHALVFSFYNGAEMEITAKDRVQVGTSGEDRIYFAGTDGTSGRKLSSRKGRTIVKTCQFRITNPEDWKEWKGLYSLNRDVELMLYYIDIGKKV